MRGIVSRVWEYARIALFSFLDSSNDRSTTRIDTRRRDAQPSIDIHANLTRSVDATVGRPSHSVFISPERDIVLTTFSTRVTERIDKNEDD